MSSKAKLKPAELAAREAIMVVVQGYLGNKRTENSADLVQKMLRAKDFQTVL